jgi:Zn-dependent protease with chaperone function
MADGWLYDGESAIRRPVLVEPEGDGLRVRPQDGSADFHVGSAQLLHAESRHDFEVYCREDIGGWRLGIEKPLPDTLLPLLPGRRVYGRWIDRVGLIRAVVIGLVFSASLLAVGQFAPGWIAPLVPQSWERKFGNAIVGDFGDKYCRTPAGQAALDKLGAKLGAAPGELRIRVVNVPMVNAAALPGGHIMIFRELLERAEGPDEVAGVLAHEIAHVKERHVTEMMIRQLGFSLILASVGGSTAGNVETLMTARYSRGSESEADERAIEWLRRANISPLPTAGFFERLSGGEEKFGRVARTLEYVASHPLSLDRRKRFEASAVKGRSYAPSLSSQEWQALLHICDGRKRMFEGRPWFMDDDKKIN